MKDNKANNTYTPASTLLETFEDIVEESRELTNEQIETISGCIATEESLREGLVTLCRKAEDYSGNARRSAENARLWTETKAMWENRLALLMKVLDKTMVRLGVPKGSVTADGVKLSTRSSVTLEVDKDWLLRQYEDLAEQMQSQLPPYVKVRLDVDKTRLATYLKSNSSMLVDHPERVHTRTSRTTSIKPVTARKSA